MNSKTLPRKKHGKSQKDEKNICNYEHWQGREQKTVNGYKYFNNSVFQQEFLWENSVRIGGELLR